MSDLNPQLIKAAERGDLTTVKEISSKGTHNLNCGQALWAAASSGHLECVKHIFRLYRWNEGHQRALIGAAIGGHEECTAYLASLCTESDNTIALRALISHKQSACPMQCLNSIFLHAEHKRRIFIMVQAAFKQNNTDYLDLVLDHEPFVKAIEYVVIDPYKGYFENHINQRQNDLLHGIVRSSVEAQPNKPFKKI